MVDMKGKTVVITGASTGIGRATAEALAGMGARLVFAGRGEAKTREAMQAIEAKTGNGQLSFLPLDLDDLDSVKQAAGQLSGPLHVLINNAGLARSRGVTKQGFERTFGVNHLGHFLLTLLLRPLLEASAPARVVVVASRAHAAHRGPIDWAALRRPTSSFIGWREYQVSKLANVLFTKELARRWDAAKVHAYAVHPGVISSDIWRAVPWPFRPIIRSTMRTPEDGARASLRCATSPDVAGDNGLYYDEDGSERQPSSLARDEALAAELWEKSLEWVRPWLPA